MTEPITQEEKDTKFMTMAYEMAARSLDPSTKSGCVIVRAGRPIGGGFNRIQVTNLEDSDLEYMLEGDRRYKFTEHCERVALYSAVNGGIGLGGSDLYVNWAPCMDCARAMEALGIKNIIAHREGQMMYDKLAGGAHNWSEDHAEIEFYFQKSKHTDFHIRSIEIDESIEALFKGTAVKGKEINAFLNA